MRNFMLAMAALVLNVWGVCTYGQKSDIGLIWNQATANRFSLEYRYAMNEKIKLRVSVVAGNEPFWMTNRYLSSTDSTIKIRQFSEISRTLELRTGVERTLRWKHLSIGGDLVWHYSNRLNRYSTIDYPLQDFYGTDGIHTPINYGPDLASSTRHFAGLGLSGFIAWEYPIYERFLISARVSASGLLRYQVGRKEFNDVSNEFHEFREFGFIHTAGFGVGIRYKF